MFIAPPTTAPKRFVQITGLTGWDAFMSIVLPRALFMRVLAIKILRHAGDIPKDSHVLAQLFDPYPRSYPLVAADRIGFAYEGQPVWIVDSAGRTLNAARASELAAELAEKDAKLDASPASM